MTPDYPESEKQTRIAEIEREMTALQEEYNTLKPPPFRANVCLGIPFNWCFQPGLLQGIMHATAQRHNIGTVIVNSGCLTHGMNMLFQEFYNAPEKGYTHFGMIHSDMRPQNYWVDTLIEEMDRVGADFISAVARIKDHRGLTNMGVQEPNTTNTRRITMAELYDLPETFCASDTIYPDWWLAANTGAMLVKTGPWMHDFQGFRVQNYFTTDDARSKRFAQFYPEDWGFACWLQTQGLKVYSTRKVLTWHTGLKEWGTDVIEGEWKRDMECREILLGGKDQDYPSIAAPKKEITNGTCLASPGDDSGDRRSGEQQHIHIDQQLHESERLGQRDCHPGENVVAGLDSAHVP